MREILFRGKSAERRHSGQWIEGSLVTLDDTHIFIVPRFESASTLSSAYIVYSTIEAVDPSTVGQYTGLTDRNGLKKVFEGDIIVDESTDCTWVVIFEDGTFIGTDIDGYYGPEEVGELCDLTSGGFEGVHIIGNIHDNPDLLK